MQVLDQALFDHTTRHQQGEFKLVIIVFIIQTTEAALVQLTATLVRAARANVRCAFWSDALVYMVM